LRVIHFELRPAKHHKIHNLNERRVKLNTSTRDSKLVSSRASNLNFSTAMSIKTKHEADSNENAQEQLIVVTELTTTGSLREYLRKIQHPRLKVIKEWLYKILEAVSFLHQNEIVHGKITCESIYYNSNVAEIKVGDIGIKHIYAQAQGREDENRLTKQNDVRCIGVALLEMILAPEIPQNTHAYLKKIFSKLP
jgi:serine/threonine protein kinase